MGNTLVKHFMILPQYSYYDMVRGFISDAAGPAYVLEYPPNLLDLPKKCPTCGRGSGLQIIPMVDRLTEKRREYEEAVNEVIRKRAASGDNHPYLGYSRKALKKFEKELQRKAALDAGAAGDDPKAGTSAGAPKLLRYLKMNEVVPEEGMKKGTIGSMFKPDDEYTPEACEEKGVIYFHVDPLDLTVCSHCEKLIKFKNGETEYKNDGGLPRWRIRTRSMEWQTAKTAKAMVEAKKASKAKI